ALTINQVGPNAILDNSYFGLGGSAIINEGTIDAGLSGGNFWIVGAGSFVNQGTIDVSNGDTLSINSNGWSNSRSSDVSGGMLNLGGSFTTAQLGTINHTGGVLNVSGVLDNTGATLDVGSGTALATLTLGGTIKNGTIAAAGIGVLGTGGTLDGVT